MGSITQPFGASGPRSPTERPRSIPPAVRGAAMKMIYEGCDLVVAAQASGLRPDTMRRWLHRPELVGFLRRERAAFRQALCAGNERALAQIRDESDNAMAKVNSIKCLEDMNEDSSLRRATDTPTPGVVLNIVTVTPSPATIDITPTAKRAVSSHVLPNRDE
jgi:hypothetical protein